MELVLLLVMLAMGWLLVLRGRAVKQARRNRLTGAGIIACLAIAGWLGLQAAFSGAPDETLDYATGDTELRAILLQPETAPRYSSRQ